jgi:hypothetical protein
MGHSNWSKIIPTNEAYKRAGGRARINAHRQLKALHQAHQVIQLYMKLIRDRRNVRGIQAEITQILGIPRSTVSRYIIQWKQLAYQQHQCPTCGSHLLSHF